MFWKALDVVDSISEFSNVVVGLGGFHLLMSFTGAIGTIMVGSGLKELFCEIFAANSVDKILSGHASPGLYVRTALLTLLWVV